MAPRTLTVLVTDAGYKHAVGIIRHLGREHHRIIAVSHSSFAPGRYSRFTSKWVKVPPPTSEGGHFAAALHRICRDEQVDLVIPVGFQSVDSMTHDSSGPVGSYSCYLPSSELFDRSADKWGMIEHAKALGIRVPDSLLPASDVELESFARRYGKVVIKARRESEGKGVRLFSPSAEAKPSPLSYGRSIAQEYVPGSGVGYMALCVEGEVVREFTHRRLREWPPKGGFATAAISTNDPEIARQGREFVRALGWHGPAMVEFRVGSQGAYFIEFNPKFWGSLELALACGADFPGDLCRLASGGRLNNRPYPDYTTGLRYWWPWRGDLRRLILRPADLGKVLRDAVAPGARSNWSWCDPLPNVIEIGGELLYPFRRHG